MRPTFHTDNLTFRRWWGTCNVPMAFFLARAAEQVGTPYADVGRACLCIPPLRHGYAASPSSAACDALGLRHLLSVTWCEAECGRTTAARCGMSLSGMLTRWRV